MKSSGNKTKTQLADRLGEMSALVTGLETDANDNENTFQRLRESEEKYRSLFELSPLGITILNITGTIQSCNDAVYKIGGYSEAELVGKHFSEIAPLRTRDIPKYIKLFASIVSGKPSKPFEIEYIRKDGKQGWSEIQAAVIETDGKKTGIQVIQRDITERKQAKKARLESEKKYSTLFEELNDAVFLADVETGRIVDTNKKAEILLGRTRKEIIGIHQTELHPPELADEYRKRFSSHIRKGHAADYDGKVITKNGSIVPVRINAVHITIEGKKMMLGLFSDITERITAMEALRDSEEIFRVLFENSNELLSIMDMKGNIVRVNSTWKNTLGYTREALSNPVENVHPEDRTRVMEHLEAAISGKAILESIKYRYKTAGGDYIWLDTIERNIQVAERDLILVASRDVSEQQRIEVALQESEEFNTSLLENEPHQINVINPDGSIKYVNTAFQKANGWTLEEVIGIKPPYPWWPKGNEDKQLIGFNRAMKNGSGKAEVLAMKKNGESYWIDINWAPVMRDGKLDYLLVNAIDITDRKQAEIALKESEDFRLKLLDIAPNPIIVVNPDSTTRYVNPAFEKLTGFSAGEVVGNKPPNPWWRNSVLKEATAQSIIDLENPKSAQEVLFQKKNGERFWITSSSTPVRTNDKLQYTLVIWNDITERKQAETALKESEEFRSRLLDISPNPIFVVNPDTSIRYANPALEKLTGFTKEELIEMKSPYPWWREKHRKQIQEKLDEGMQIERRTEEALFQKKNGEKFWVESSSTPVKINGNTQYTLVTWNDVTERKQIEEEVRLRAELLDNAGDSINVIDLEGNFIYINEVFCRSHEYSRDELMGMTIGQLVALAPNLSVESRLKAIEAAGESVFETVHIRKDGTEIKLEVHSRTIESGGKKLILNVERDITDRLKKEEEIKKLSTAIEYSPNTILITDKNSIIEYVNRKYIEITGYKANEVTGKSLRSIGLQPEKEYKKMWKALTNSKDWYDEFINRKKNGELYYEATSITGIKDNAGNITHFLRVATDITEKKRTEGELQRSEQQLRELTTHMRQIREEERKSIARNIHDNLGQSLTALKIDMSWLMKRLTPDQLPLIEKANEMASMIDQNIQTVKKLSSELRPEILDILGLTAAIEWYTEEFSNRTRIKCIMDLGEDDISLERDYAVDCYRIFQESLTNISVHAGATRVRVTLKQDPDKLIMQIKDNGKGITREKSLNARSFGLIGMRERASSIGGNLEIKSARGKGTTVKLTVPTK
ncbi:PAS domain S-box protein [Chloroflexota bacterium]